MKIKAAVTYETGAPFVIEEVELAVPKVFIPQLLDYYRRGQFPFDRLVKYYPFSEINTAFKESHEGVCIKAILRIDE